MSIHARIAELGITLPEPAKPVASYVSYVRSGEQIFISGQLSNDASGGIKGTVGVDVEHRDELKRDLWKTVFLPREIDALDAAFDMPMRGRMALVLFSAKEALYKAQYPRTTTFMGFHELHVAISPDPREPTRGTLRCTFQNDVGALDRDGFARASVAHGRFQLEAAPGAEVLTSVLIPAKTARNTTE